MYVFSVKQTCTRFALARTLAKASLVEKVLFHQVGGPSASPIGAKWRRTKSVFLTDLVLGGLRPQEALKHAMDIERPFKTPFLKDTVKTRPQFWIFCRFFSLFFFLLLLPFMHLLSVTGLGGHPFTPPPSHLSPRPPSFGCLGNVLNQRGARMYHVYVCARHPRDRGAVIVGELPDGSKTS